MQLRPTLRRPHREHTSLSPFLFASGRRVPSTSVRGSFGGEGRFVHLARRIRCALLVSLLCELFGGDPLRCVDVGDGIVTTAIRTMLWKMPVLQV